MHLETILYGDRWFFRFVECLIPVHDVEGIWYRTPEAVAAADLVMGGKPYLEGQVIVRLHGGQWSTLTPVKAEPIKTETIYEMIATLREQVKAAYQQDDGK